MIKYQLICDQKHEFEGWFQGSAAYVEQAANGLLRCPLCDSDQVKRALMTPNLASPKQRKSNDRLICAALGWRGLASSTPVLPDHCHIMDNAIIHLQLVQHKRHCPETNLQIHVFDRK